MRKPCLSSAPSFALISVLAMVSLAAMSATAFLASARLERLASRPLADVTRLEMASRTGLSMAMQMMVQLPVAQNPALQPFRQRVVTYWRTNEGDDVGYLFFGMPKAEYNAAADANGLAMTYFPMFSTASMASNALNPDSTLTNQSVVQVDLPGNYRRSISNFLSTLGTNFSANFPFGANNPAFTNLITLGGATSPPVAWVPIYSLQKVKGTTNWSNLPAARFAFFVEDMEGLIDVERMGGQTNRASGTNALEISLSNAVGSTMTNKVATLTNPANRPVYFSPGMIVSKGGLSTNDLRYITTGIQSWKSGNPTDGWFLTIPYGLAARTNPAGGYTNALAKKILINTSAVNVDSLATLLSNNLPHFGQRAGGLTNNNRFDYYKCIAANIVDYIDANQTPSIQTGAGGYRGTEALPLVSEVAMSIHWTNQLKSGVQYQEEFEVVHVVELWNMFNKAFNGTVNFGYDSSLTAQVGLTPSFSLNSATYRTSGQLTNAYNVSLQPNEFRAYASPPIRYRVLSGLGTEPKYGGGLTASNNGFLTFGRPGSPGANNYSSGWTLSTSAGLVYDKTTAIEEPTFTARCEKFTTGANTNPDFKNHQPALRLDPPNATGEVLFGTGDLRISYFTTNNVNPNATGIFNASTFADSGSLGYRNTIWAYTVRKGSTNRPDLWLDGGYANSSSQKWGQDVRVYTPGGAVNGAFAPALAAHPPSAAIQQEAPAYIADAQMTNIFELGRIFDPMQWKTAVPMTPAVPQATNPTNITSTSIADFQQGGGNTLRVGRAEHQRFAFSDRFGTDPVPFLGQSAASLLDLFTVMDPTTGESAGRININTAPRAVLAALAGGISLTNDPAMAMAPVNDTMINAFTQGVCKFRMLYPFMSPSQLTFISPDYGTGNWTNNFSTNAVFSTNSPAGGLQGARIADAAVEEWFSKIFHLSQVGSMNLRCYVISQLTDTNGMPRGAPIRRYYQIYTTPYSGGANSSYSATVTQEGSY